MTYQNLQIANDLSVRTITINRPDKLNALNRDTLVELHNAFKQAANDAAIRVVVLTGSGPKAFVAGADIAEMNELSPCQALEFSRLGQRLMSTIEQLGKPVIAMINGYCLGGGMELAMACHLRIAADSAKMGLPEINLGLMPGFGGTQRLLRLVGRSAALELCLFGKTIDVSRALDLRLIHQSHAAEQLSAQTQILAQQLASSAPIALKAILDSILLAGEADLAIGLDYESQAFGLLFSTADKKEGSRAFLEKRKAKFIGQ